MCGYFVLFFKSYKALRNLSLTRDQIGCSHNHINCLICGSTRLLTGHVRECIYDGCLVKQLGLGFGSFCCKLKTTRTEQEQEL